MIKGSINLDIDHADLTQLKFTRYFPCYTQTVDTKKYYTHHNSSIWQMHDEESPAWVHDLVYKLPSDFAHHTVSVIKIPPGQTVPVHLDRHYLLKEMYGDGDTWRYLIFLQDWLSGHYFELNNEPIVQWKAGDWIKIHNSEWHIGGNMGENPFYSVQITVK